MTEEAAISTGVGIVKTVWDLGAEIVATITKYECINKVYAYLQIHAHKEPQHYYYSINIHTGYFVGDGDRHPLPDVVLATVQAGQDTSNIVKQMATLAAPLKDYLANVSSELSGLKISHIICRNKDTPEATIHSIILDGIVNPLKIQFQGNAVVSGSRVVPQPAQPAAGGAVAAPTHTPTGVVSHLVVEPSHLADAVSKESALHPGEQFIALTFV